MYLKKNPWKGKSAQEIAKRMFTSNDPNEDLEILIACLGGLENVKNFKKVEEGYRHDPSSNFKDYEAEVSDMKKTIFSDPERECEIINDFVHIYKKDDVKIIVVVAKHFEDGAKDYAKEFILADDQIK